MNFASVFSKKVGVDLERKGMECTIPKEGIIDCLAFACNKVRTLPLRYY
jgi:hypothetical protein